jgi:phage protein D
MKEDGTITFRGLTASQVVRQIAAFFNFDVDIVDHSQVWPVLHMAGMSFWAFCVMLAKRIGYTFYCNGTTLVFKPRQLDPSNITGYVTTYDYRADPGGMPVFTPTLGATNPTGGELVNRHLYNINLETNQVIYASASGSPAPTAMGTYLNLPLFDSIEHATANNQAEANAKVQGMGQSNQLYITAGATVIGNPLIAQGSLIIVNNANGSQNGLWYVTRAEHQMDNSNYTLDMEVGRDSLGANPAAISGVPQTSLPSNTVMKNSTWVASV